ncbi:hypothetical protein Goshw_005730 [Gossypium schwendimanii]|uniref:Uncharacterized protein n=1 Tax=Gossypium schwendimanii TaxID=34291 RepID=A0A7J9M9Z8_GOSSC|nr:hypothetical protein [Gossypium schwendimanii]
MFNDITKSIGRRLNSNVTLPHGIYLSYLFRQLGISTHGYSPITSNQPICYGALHHVEYHFDANTSTWIKSDHPVDNEDDDIAATFEDVLAPNPALPLTSSSYIAQSSSKVNSAILHAIHSLSNDVRGLQEEVRSRREDINSKLSSLESQMASLLACFPLTPTFSPPHDD